jgi:hypothetical protein
LRWRCELTIAGWLLPHSQFTESVNGFFYPALLDSPLQNPS